MEVISIGRNSDCNIVYDENMISRRHAILKIHATGKMEIISMGTNGTFVNGVKLPSNKPVVVKRKDVVSFAHVRELNWDEVPNPLKKVYLGIGVAGTVLFFALFIALGVKLFSGSSAPKYEQAPETGAMQARDIVIKEKTVEPITEKTDTTTEKDSKVSPNKFFPSETVKNTKENLDENKKEESKKEEEKVGAGLGV